MCGCFKEVRRVWSYGAVLYGNQFTLDFTLILFGRKCEVSKSSDLKWEPGKCASPVFKIKCARLVRNGDHQVRLVRLCLQFLQILDQEYVRQGLTRLQVLYPCCSCC